MSRGRERDSERHRQKTERSEVGRGSEYANEGHDLSCRITDDSEGEGTRSTHREMARANSPKSEGKGGATVRFGNPVTQALSQDIGRPLSHDFDNPASDEGSSSGEALRGSVRTGDGSTFDSADAQQPPQPTIAQAFAQNFLGHSPVWYKQCMVGFLFVNIVIRFTLSKKLCAWAVLLEFIFTLACGLYCYPLQSGGLVVGQAFLLGLASSHTMIHEVEANLNVLLLVIFMVAAIHFLKNLLLWTFTKLLLGVESKILMSVLLMFTTAALSAFLDALSVAAVLVSVCMGILGVYFHVVADADLPVDETHHEVGVGAGRSTRDCSSVTLCAAVQ